MTSMSVKQNLTKAFNVGLIVASFSLVGAITAGVFSGDDAKVVAAEKTVTPAKGPAPVIKP